MNQSVQYNRDILKPNNVSILIDSKKNGKIMRYENNLIKLMQNDKKAKNSLSKTR